MSTPLPPLPEIEQLSPRVIRILGGNPGKFTLQGTNTYLVGTGASRILIDTGGGQPCYLGALRSVLALTQSTITSILLTHHHADHTGGLADVLSLCPLAQIHQHTAAPPRLALRDGQVLAVEGAALRAVWAPGHTADHVAFVLLQEDALFAGDAVLGHGTVVFADLGAYVRSLERLKGVFAGRVYPGHGEVVADGPAKVAEYLAHRRRREEQVLEVLRRGGGWAVEGIVGVVYNNVPEALHLAAGAGVGMVLEKLLGEGRVLFNEGEGTWRIARGSVL